MNVQDAFSQEKIKNDINVAAYLDRRLKARGLPLQFNSQCRDFEAALKFIRIDTRLRFLSVETQSAQRHFLGSNRYESMVSFDVESVECRYYLTAHINGKVNIFDSRHPITLFDETRIAAQEPLQYPLGYVPSEEENAEREKARQEIPVVTPVVTTFLREKTVAQPLSCCKWLPDENEALISSSLDGKLMVWDINRFESATIIPVPLFQITTNPIHYFAANGELVTRNLGLTRYYKSKSGDHRIIACCSLGSKSNLRLLDLRTGSFVSDFSFNQQNSKSSQLNTGTCCATWSPSNSYTLISGGLNGMMAHWDIRKYSNGYVFGFHMDNIDMDQNLSRLSQLRQAMSQKTKVVNIPKALESSSGPTIKNSSSTPSSKFDASLYGFPSEDLLYQYIKESHANPDVHTKPNAHAKLGTLRNRDARIRRNAQTTPSMQVIPCKKKTRIDTTSGKNSEFYESQIKSHNYPISTVTFISGGAYIISSTIGTSNNFKSVATREHLKLWNATTGKLVSIVYDPPKFESINFSEEKFSVPKNIFATRPEVLDLGHKFSSSEYYCTGLMQGLAIYEALSGKLVKYVPNTVSKDIRAVASFYTPSLLTESAGMLITADTKGQIFACRCDESSESTSVTLADEDDSIWTAYLPR